MKLKNTMKILDAMEGEILDRIISHTPGDDTPNSTAIPLLNSLESRIDKVTKAFDLIRWEVTQ
jgi:hypothetical protein